jgi:predicted small secreted protein
MSVKNFKSILVLVMVVCVAFALLAGCSNTANADVIDSDAVVDEAADESATDEAADNVLPLPVKRYGPF